MSQLPRRASSTPPFAIFAQQVDGAEPQAWLTDVLERMVSGRTKVRELERLLPWAWKAEWLQVAIHA